MMEILVPTSPGELIDKLTILQIKVERIDDPRKLSHVRHERDLLQKIAQGAIPDSAELTQLRERLYQINGDLWAIEDDIRACESRGDFGPTFVALARSVYVTNDERAAVKKQINVLLGSAIVEEKSYTDRKPRG